MRLVHNLAWSISWFLTERDGCGCHKPKEFFKPQNCMVPASATTILNFSAKVQKRLHQAVERWADQSAPLGTYLADCDHPRHLERQQQLPEINGYVQESSFQTPNSRDNVCLLKIRCSQVFSDNAIISRAAPSQEERCPWGLGQEPAGNTCCAGQRFTSHTNLIGKTLRESDFSQTPGSKYNSLVCKAFPWPWLTSCPKRKLDIILLYNFTDRLLCSETLFILQIHINEFVSQNAPLIRNSCQEYTPMKSCKWYQAMIHIHQNTWSYLRKVSSTRNSSFKQSQAGVRLQEDRKSAQNVTKPSPWSE